MSKWLGITAGIYDLPCKTMLFESFFPIVVKNHLEIVVLRHFFDLYGIYLSVFVALLAVFLQKGQTTPLSG